jgi:hypothetical protein
MDMKSKQGLINNHHKNCRLPTAVAQKAWYKFLSLEFIRSIIFSSRARNNLRLHFSKLIQHYYGWHEELN